MVKKLAILLFLLSFTSSAIAQQTQQPELPDFTQNSYTKYASGLQPYVGHDVQVPGATSIDQYYDENSHSVISVFLDKNSKFLYATWTQYSSEIATTREYSFKNGKFVFQLQTKHSRGEDGRFTKLVSPRITPETPSLPDYTKDPYTIYVKNPQSFPNGDCSRCSPIFHKDWGIIPAKLYRDSKSESKDTINWIMVFLNEDGTPRYAEWIEQTIKDTPPGKIRETVRGYLFKDGQWVFEKEESAESNLP